MAKCRGFVMPVQLVAQASIKVGEPVVLEGPSPGSSFAVVFEDDGQTGYFYGLDFAREENPILDALHIYNVEQVVDRELPTLAQVVWSSDNLKAALLLNNVPHAIFDFSARRGYCRTGFPPADPKWSEFDHSWDEVAIELFR